MGNHALLGAGAVALARFDQVLFAAAAVWVASSAVAFASPPAIVGEAERLRGLSGELALYFEEARAEPLAAPAHADALRARLDPPAVVADLPGWVLHKRPGFLYTVPPGLPPVEIVHSPPGLRVRAVERGRVELEVAPGRLVRVILEGFALEREAEGGEWVLLAALPAGAREYVDEDVIPRGRYRYRVTSRVRLDVDDPALRARGVRELAPELVERTSAPTEGVEVPRELRFLVRTVTLPDVLRERPGGATLVVERWDPARGEFRGRYVQAVVGEPIGDSGAVLLEVGIEEREVRAGWRRPVPWVLVQEPGHAPERFEGDRPGD